MIYNDSTEDINQLLFEYTELLDFTLSNEFIKRWKDKYSVKFIKLFQARLLKCLSDRRCLKLSTLYTFLTSKCNYSKEQVINFLESIDIEAYQPIVTGFIEEL
jgi:hypothetical protein|tara:strand:- start:114 stop:422 length:309 start_codon:yes stop_codon:yes gene_type:complete